MKNSKSTDALPLSVVINELRSDLESSALKRDDSFVPLFRISEVNAEFSVSFERELGVEGKVNVIVAKFGATGSEKGGASHKIAVKLVPIETAGPSSKSGQAPGVQVIAPINDPLVRGKK